MKIQFREWIYNQNISVRTTRLIDEAFICYKGEAYKAALLFSFIAFQNIIKERMLQSNRPPGIPEGLWINIQQELRDDDKWDRSIISNIDRNQPTSIFNLSEEMKRQYTYWKDRRNDCAHAKSNIIDASHVETFWLFIRSSLSKFNVNGGKESLIEKIKLFYDKNYTPRDEDPKPIIEDIPSSIESNTDLKEILSVIYEFDKTEIDFNLNIWKQLFTLEEENREVLLGFLKERDNLLLEILIYDPSKISFFCDDPGFIRTIWTNKIYNSFTHYKIVLGLLRNDLIPENQLREFVSTVTNKINTDLFRQAEEADITVLENSGFFGLFYKLAFVDIKINNFDWARENKYLIVQYIKRYGLDEVIVKACNNTFMTSSHPWKLQEALNDMFKENPQLVDEYKKINEEIDGLLPEYLF
ncbi:hypothetical protein AS034_01815 [[Bacillus] enclensis]|uniref:Uncharacterized protein n=1 Tax=[Bacillus] enclensis TaxID=1402860 RepID=A0A0V8HPU3_9BACI|nr:hypothetical protein [[Bacillus] enclensis]KSU64598.1 hypothetical protein AS034_01815 [[Bacillus] enclensis]SCB76871.1 hypothetical protein GA0061094_0377 [[Bacillus] enclensis]